MKKIMVLLVLVFGVYANAFADKITDSKENCEGGNSKTCFNLGWMYNQGKGVKQGNSEAVEFYKKACDLKSQTGCDNYAKLKKQLKN